MTCRHLLGGFECVDTTNSLSACGGCPGPEGNGQDCLAIPGALNVQCADSKCIVGEFLFLLRAVLFVRSRC